MSKPVYLDRDNSDALNEQALRAQQAETASSVRAPVATAALPAASATTLAVKPIAATAVTSHVATGSQAASASVPEGLVSHSLAPLNAADGLASVGGDDTQAVHAFTNAEIASASAIMTSDIKSGPLGRFDTQLAALYLEHSSQAVQTIAATSAVTQFSDTIHVGANGHDYVTIDAHAKDGDGATLLAEMQSLGSGFLHGSAYHGLVSGQVDVSQLGSLLHMADFGNAVESAHFTSVGLVTSQAVQAEGVDTATNEYGLDGSGLKIGVLSDSFDEPGSYGINGLPDTMATDIASGDLPANTTVLQDYVYGANEGRGMAQLIHDIAPGSAIEFATAGYGEANFANNIEALAAAGSKVLVDDVGYFFEPAFQNGIISQAVDDVVANQGVTYFSSAGNDFDAGWTGASVFESAETNTSAMFGGAAGLNGAPDENIQLVQFAPGEDYLPLTMPELPEGKTYRASTFISLQWNDPDSNTSGSGYGGTAGSQGPTSDLDLFVYDVTRHTVIAYSDDNNAMTGNPIEIAEIDGFTSTGARIYAGGDDIRVYVGAASLGATPPSEIKVLSLGDGIPFELGDANTNATAQTLETSFGHGAAPGAITVGAASYTDTPAYGSLTPINEYYSSDGAGVTLYYDDNGNRLATPEVLQKVDLTAVDNVDTTFFGYDSDGDGYPNFAGTSAAAPDAAAVALLMVQADPNLTPSDIRHLEMDSAIPMADFSGTYEIGGTGSLDFTLGFNGTAGAGLIQADVALGFIENGMVIENDQQTALYGTEGADTIIGGPNSQVIEGFGGADVLVAATGVNTFDTFVYSAVTDSDQAAYDTIENFHTGLDAIDLRLVDNGEVFLGQTTSGGTDVLFDLVDGEFQGLIYSTAAVNPSDVFVNTGTIVVDYGAATGGDLTGSTGDDIMIAQGGPTTFDGGYGGDILYSAASGKDTFVYLNANESFLSGNPTSYDQIFDFKVGIDKIDLSNFAALYPDDTVVIAHTADGSSNVYFEPDAANTTGGGYDGFIYVSGSALQASDIIDPGTQIILEGGFDGDTLIGGTGGDILIAGVGTETLIGGFGQDIMYAGSGPDTFVINGPQDSSTSAPDVIFDFKSGVDKIDLSGTAATLNTIEFIHDASGDTTINFVANGTTFFGSVNVEGAFVQLTDVNFGTANPYVYLDGSSNAETLSAGPQNTTLYGAGGADTLNGGSGADYFIYFAISDSSTTAADTINGFKSGTDKIDISAIDGGTVELTYTSAGTVLTYGNGGEIVITDAAVQAGDLKTSGGATVVTDGLAGDFAAQWAADMALHNAHTASVFGH